MLKPPAHEDVCKSIMMRMILFRGEKHGRGSDSDYFRIFTHSLLPLRGLSLITYPPTPLPPWHDHVGILLFKAQD